MATPVRLNKYLADNHYCSRREADRLIASGRVFLNDKPANLGDKVGERDVVRVLGRDKRVRERHTYMLLNKPAGISTNKKKEHSVFQLVSSEKSLIPIGDMDVRDEGLLLLTTDAFFAKRLVSQRAWNDQEFVVEVTQPLTRSIISQLQNGIQLNDGMTKPAKVRQLDPMRFAIIPTEQKPDLIRRMAKALDLEIETLMRTRISTLKMISTYPVGHVRHLTISEIKSLKEAIGITEAPKSLKKHRL